MSPKGHYKQISTDGFEPLTHSNSDEMNNPNDVTIDIPLTKVTTNKSTTGARKPNAISPARTLPPVDFPEQLSEKKSHFRRGPAGRRKRVEQQGLENKDRDDGSLNAAGRFYMKIFHFSIVTRYFLYVAPVALAIAVPIVIGATAAPNARIGGVKIVWFFTWVEAVWVSLWVSKLFAQFLPYVFQFLCGIVSSGTRKYALVITALEIPLSLVGWAAASLPTFVVLMTQNPDQRSRGDTSLKPWQNVVKNILFACLFSTIVLLAEKLLIQLLSISYHRKQFDDKIKDSKRNIYLVSLLYDASRALFPAYCPEFAEEDYLINDSLDLGFVGSTSEQGHQRSGSVTPMRLIQNVARVGDKVTAAFGNVAHEITGKQVFNPTAAHSIVVEALEKKHSSEALAKRLWMSFVVEGRDALYPDDIVEVLGEGHEEDAHEAFDCLDADGNGDISLEEMILRITEFGRERHAIANSMHDVDQAINVLDNLLCTVVLIMVIFIFVAWLNHSFTTTLATAGTALLSLSFVFAATAQEVLGSCIFLFVKHPFDVGDRVDISETPYVVERISLLYTKFRSVKTHKHTQVPNIVLNSLWIDNVSRSKAMREQVLLYVNFDTSLEDVELLKTEMTNFVRHKDNARDFQQDIDVEVTGLAEMNKMELKVEIRHKSNWANEAVRASRRSKFMCALVLALRKVPIYGPGAGAAPAGDKANPTYSVAITDGQAKNNKDKFDQDKDAKRLVPTLSKTTSGATAGKSSSIDNPLTSDIKESAALEGLSKRNAAVDPARDSGDDQDRKRSTDIEEVRDMLRSESVTGKRRTGNPMSPISSNTRSGFGGSQTIPTIAEPSPPEPISKHPPPRISYFEDNSNVSQQHQQQRFPSLPRAIVNQPQGLATAAAGGSVDQEGSSMQQQKFDDVRLASASYNPEQQQQQQQQRYLPGNAFSQQQYQSRKKVPGMGQMKDYLHSQNGEA